MELTTAFAVFANGGYRVQPHFIKRIEDPRGNVVYSTPKVVLCDDCGIEEEASIEDNPLVAEMEAETEVAEEAMQTDNGGDSSTTTDEASAAAVEAESQAELASAVALDVVNAPRVIDARNAWIMNSMLREVVQRGTGRRAGEALKRKDLAGKTGTTNNQLDAWFCRF